MDNQIEAYHSRLPGREPLVFCDVCSSEIIGPCFFEKDLMVCKVCYDDFYKPYPILLQPRVAMPIISVSTVALFMLLTTPGVFTMPPVIVAIFLVVIFWKEKRWDLRKDA